MFISAFRTNDLKELSEKLVLFGAKKLKDITKKSSILNFPNLNLFYGNISVSRLETIDVNNWTEQDVQEWLGYLHTNDGNLKNRYSHFFEGIDGETLINLEKDELKEIGINSFGMREKIWVEIKKLKNTRTYDLNEHHVFSKVKNMDHKYLKTIPDMENMVKSLCSITDIRKTYLSTERVRSGDLQRWIEASKTVGEEDTDFDLVDTKHPIPYQELKLKVKVVVTEIAHTDQNKKIRKLLSPVVARIPGFSGEFGLFHTSIIVGPWYLEWTNSSLCIPKRICSSMALLSADIETIIIPQKGLEEIADKLAEVVVHWNVNMGYNQFTKKNNKTEGNCQDFVDAVLEKLELKPYFTGALYTFLKQMRVNGVCKLEFKPDKGFKKKFNLNQNTYTFSTHAELDTFVIKLRKKLGTLKLDFPSEWGLLKSFDRAFWLRHLKNPQLKKHAPLSAIRKIGGKDKSIVQCPFGDPRITGSYC